jgi:hypothetical protein
MSQDHAIPPQILELLVKPPLLKGESVQQYDELFGGLVTQVVPVDLIEWLWVLNYLDCTWEVLRLRRFKSVLIDLQQRRALEAVILKTVPINGKHTPSSLAQTEALWSADSAHFTKHGVDPLSVPAMAVVQIKNNLEALNKMLERAERRCDTCMQQLEYRREVFAHRARRAADNLLNAKTDQIPSLTSVNTSPALAPPNLTTPNQIPPDEVTIVPESSAAEACAPEESPAEASEATISSAEQTAPNQIPPDEVTVVPTQSVAEAVAPTSEETSAETSQSAPASDA